MDKSFDGYNWSFQNKNRKPCLSKTNTSALFPKSQKNNFYIFSMIILIYETRTYPNGVDNITSKQENISPMLTQHTITKQNKNVKTKLPHVWLCSVGMILLNKLSIVYALNYFFKCSNAQRTHCARKPKVITAQQSQGTDCINKNSSL